MGQNELQPSLSPRGNVTEQAASAIDDNRKMRVRTSGSDAGRADVVKMERKHFDGTAISVVQQKTGTHVWFPRHQRLRDHARTTGYEQPHLLVSSLGCVFGRL
jgi:hypothetical protein